MNIHELEDLYSFINKLKRLKRAGWVRAGVKDSESVADHSFSLALVTMYFAESLRVNASEAVYIALLHDLGESIIGDITPHDGVNIEDKRANELAAMQTILLPIDPDGRLLNLWLDFEEGRTPEGRLVKQLDKLEAYLQARAYNVDVVKQAEFLESTKAVLQDDTLRKIINDLEKTESNQA